MKLKQFSTKKIGEPTMKKTTKPKPTQSPDIIFQIGQFHFFDEICNRGSFKEMKNTRFGFHTYFFVNRAEKTTKNQMLIDFKYDYHVQPNILQLGTSGSCILESPTLNNLEKMLKENRNLFIKVIARPIIKQSYSQISKILLENRIRFPLLKMKPYLESCEKIGLIQSCGINTLTKRSKNKI